MGDKGRVTWRDKLNAIKREREFADREDFLDASPEEQLYIIHKDFERISKELKSTRKWIFFVLLFTFLAVSQIAQFFNR